MISKDCINLKYLKAAFLRRFWWITLPFFAVSIATAGYCVKTPWIYKAETLILVDRQKAPQEHIESTMTLDLGKRLGTITRQIKSRERLEKIINEYDLYPDVRVARTMTDAVEVFQKKIEINLRGSSQHPGTDSFEIAYISDDPVKARDITNAIANLVIEDNFKQIESEVTVTNTSIDDELKSMKGILRQKEEQVQEFEEKNVGLIPEKMEDNVRTLTKLQQQISSLNKTIRQTEERKVLLQTKLSKLKAARADTKEAVGQDGDFAKDQEPPTLEELRLQLQSLKSRYSNKHPDVIRLVATIAKLEKKQNESTAIDSDTKGNSIHPFTSKAQKHMFLQKEDLLSQLKLIDKQLAKLDKKKKNTRWQIAQYRKRVEERPKIEQMLVDMRKDLKETRENYQALLKKSLQAENIDKSPQGEQLKILTPATLPEKPVKPNHRKILVLGFLIAIACGFGLAFSREYLDPTFFSSNQLESIVKLPVLVSIPIVNTKKEHQWNILKMAGAATALVLMVSVLFYELFILWKTVPAAFGFTLG